MALIVPRRVFLDSGETYDGRQLRSHWIYDTAAVEGDAIVAFVAPADVRGDNLVDLADRRDGLFIAARKMLHFIAESFSRNLIHSVFMQRLLVLLVYEKLQGLGIKDVTRSGDDLFVGGGKLSVSIATVSGVSSLVHMGLNVVNEGTPLKTAALEPLGIDPRIFGDAVLEAYCREMETMARAIVKVRSVS